MKWLRKMAREDIASIAPRQEFVGEFAGSAILHNQLVKKIRADEFEIRYRSADRW